MAATGIYKRDRGSQRTESHMEGDRFVFSPHSIQVRSLGETQGKSSGPDIPCKGSTEERN